MNDGPAREADITRASWTRWLLIIPFIASLWVPFYNGVDPKLWGIPLFYWYQLIWVLLCSAICGIVYASERN